MLRQKPMALLGLVLALASGCGGDAADVNMPPMDPKVPGGDGSGSGPSYPPPPMSKGMEGTQAGAAAGNAGAKANMKNAQEGKSDAPPVLGSAPVLAAASGEDGGKKDDGAPIARGSGPVAPPQIGMPTLPKPTGGGGGGGGLPQSSQQASGTQGASTTAAMEAARAAAAAGADGSGTYSSGGGGGGPAGGGSGSSAVFGFSGGASGEAGGGHSVADLGGQAPKEGEIAKVDDPEDYFTRIELADNLFKIVEKRYRVKSSDWLHDIAQGK